MVADRPTAPSAFAHYADVTGDNRYIVALDSRSSHHWVWFGALMFMNEHLGRSPSEPPPPAVRAALERVLASEPFRGSLRKSRFLTFIVEQSLAGRRDRITSYDIAIGAFDRDERFDPDTDPLVRIAARRVRAALDQYYLTAGRGDAVRIRIPKGHYIPAFEWSAESAPAAIRSGIGLSAETFEARGASWLARAGASLLVFLLVAIASLTVPRWRSDLIGSVLPPHAAHDKNDHKTLRISIGPLRPLGAQPNLDQAAGSVTRAIAQGLHDFDVVPPTGPADVQLDGTIQANGNAIRVRLLLIASNGKVLWTTDYTLDGRADAPPDAAFIDTVRQALENLEAAPP